MIYFFSVLNIIITKFQVNIIKNKQLQLQKNKKILNKKNI